MKYGELTLGQIEALVNKLGGLRTVKEILSEAAKVTVEVLNHVVDGNADPFVPDGFKVEEHKKQGDLKLTRDGDSLYLNGQKIEFYLSKSQQDGKSIVGDKLRKELTSKPVLNANVLDYLREHPEIIPESWKKDEQGNTRYIFFWGSVYRYSDGDPCVRYLYWRDGRWSWCDDWLDRGWRGHNPAALSQVNT